MLPLRFTELAGPVQIAIAFGPLGIPLISGLIFLHIVNLRRYGTAKVGLGGWLLVLLLYEIFRLFNTVIGALGYFATNSLGLRSEFRWSLYAEALADLIAIGLSSFSVLLLLRQSRHYPRLLVANSLYIIILPVLDILIMAVFWGGLPSEVITMIVLPFYYGPLKLPHTVAAPLISIVYIFMSRRARRTFVR